MINKDTAIIIPVYNESTVIANTIKSVKKLFSTVICVDDGSSDESAKRILEAGAKLVQHSINLGAGAATQTGIEAALQDPSIDYFVTFDADGQHHIEDVPKMIKHLKNDDLDIVIGSRFLGKSIEMPKLKLVLLKTAIKFSNLTSGLTFTDTHNGLRVFNRYTAENLKLTMPDFSHASEILDRIKIMNFKYGEFPVTVTYSEYSKTKGQSTVNAINIAFDVFIERIGHKR